MDNKKIQVGEYIRHKTGYIDKVVATHYVSDDMKNYPENPYIKHYRDKYTLAKKGYLITSQNIKNHDFNIIKLIEAGDYVNGYLVEAIDYYEDENGNLFDVLGVVFTDDDYAYSKELKNINIHSIVTKEQFKSMEYEVGEND